jgi:hypothetical protein
LAAGGFFGSFRARNALVAQCYGKVDLDCQAIDGAGQPTGRPSLLDLIPADPPSARDLHENAQILPKPRKRTAKRRRIVRT